MPHAGKRVSDHGSLMKIRLLSWNVRRANDSSKRKLIKALIRNQRVDLFRLQETKIHAMTEGVVRSLGTGRFLDWGALDAFGSAGGILICWDKRTLEVLALEVGQFSVSCRFRNVEDGFVWMFIGVYGPFIREERECLWEELGVIRGIWEDPWCLGGDFNIILFQRERSRHGRFKKVIGKVVSLDQNAFVMGGQILDASLIANEGSFSNSKGLHQGDPLPPYFFVMEMEVLSVLITRAIDGGFLSGCRIWGRGRTEMNISHLLFADDTVVFCEAKKEHLTYLNWTLFWFEAASGLRINLDKSEIFPVGEVEEVEELVVELRCRVGSLPSSYLGLPLGAHHNSLSVWDGVEERVRRRLALWKRQYISKGGRITLIKSMMARGNLERKVHLVKWEVVCADKEKGGLGIRKLALLNKALLGKWTWRFACEKENLWKKVISVKYGQEGLGWRTNEANGTFGVGCGIAALSQSLPQLYALAVHRNATVDEVRDSFFGQGRWNLRFIRAFNDWELDLVGDLLTILRGYRLTLEEDLVTWKGGGNGKFGVKEAYNLLFAPNDISFPKNCIWVDRGPNQSCLFCLGGYVGEGSYPR
ncbi:hypothetical protein CK203_082175 [Vitis vinifera]|uniref:Uncharacterized protein n=1 Tax=Vitis vinifera TaxID=29760 RepID=A0A438CN87_VITVI|nr:hypothetical protein CK203_082175 [Vitis vinifera]